MWLIFFGGSCHRFTVNWVFPAVCAYSSRAVGQHPHRPTSTFLTLTRDITFCWHSPPVRDEPQCPSTSILVVPCSWCIKNTRTWSTQMLCRAYITQLQSPFDLGFVFCLQPGFKLVWMCYMGVKACGSSSSGLSLTSLTPVFSPSLLHQLIQAWSDTWASGVSAAIKMPPLHRFNWNFCCWCVNSCRTAKGRSIKVCGTIGPCVSLNSKGPSVSENVSHSRWEIRVLRFPPFNTVMWGMLFPSIGYNVLCLCRKWALVAQTSGKYAALILQPLWGFILRW